MMREGRKEKEVLYKIHPSLDPLAHRTCTFNMLNEIVKFRLNDNQLRARIMRKLTYVR
jgi:hypothetical protein